MLAELYEEAGYFTSDVSGLHAASAGFISLTPLQSPVHPPQTRNDFFPKPGVVAISGSQSVTKRRGLSTTAGP